MLDYARQRLIHYLAAVRTVVFISSGPAGVQADELPCEAQAGLLYVLLPGSSDHLYNLEKNPRVTLLAPVWQMRGRASVVSDEVNALRLSLLGHETAAFCLLLQVEAQVLQVRQENGWGYVETIDMAGKRQGN